MTAPIRRGGVVMSSVAPIRFLSPVPASAAPADTPRPVRWRNVTTVGLLDNSKDRVEVLLGGLADALRVARPGLLTLGWEKEHHSKRSPERHLAECAERCQLAVLALAA
jgi:hypothetical protein